MTFLGPLLGVAGTWVIGAITKIPMKLRPVVAMVAGIPINLFANNAIGDGFQWQDIFDGIVIGLTAVGIYSGAKNVSQHVRRTP